VTARLDDGAWLRSPTHHAWATAQAIALLEFFRPTVDAGGAFFELDDDGRPLPDGAPPSRAPQQNLLTVTRAVHCYAAGEMLGIPGCGTVVEQGLDALWESHRDPIAGGYLSAVPGLAPAQEATPQRPPTATHSCCSPPPARSPPATGEPTHSSTTSWR